MNINLAVVDRCDIMEKKEVIIAQNIELKAERD